MTGFGTASRPWETPEGPGVLEVEARSVNARHLEVRLRQPFGAAIEHALRQRVEARFGRGRIDVTVSVRRAAPEGATRPGPLAVLGVDPDRLFAVVRACAEARATAHREGLEVSDPSSLDLLRFSALPDRASSEAALPVAPPFFDALVEGALDGLAAFRDSEGAALGRVLTTLADELASQVARIRVLAAGQAEAMAERLHQRVRELCETTGVDAPDPTRLAQEVALLALRGDVAEELARLEMHLARIGAVLAAPAASGQGRTLEFVSQELLREITTIGSKIGSHAAAALVIDAKGSLERIREQVSNVE